MLPEEFTATMHQLNLMLNQVVKSSNQQNLMFSNLFIRLVKV